MADTSISIHHLSDERYMGHNEAGDQTIIDGEDVALGVRPMETLLAALGTCTAFDIVSILAKRRTLVESHRIKLEGERAEEVYLLGGEGITPQSFGRAFSLSHEKYCSVAASLNAEIEYEAVLE